MSGLFFCIGAGVLHAQTLDLKGRVVANGVPVADATVSLQFKGASVKTGADGAFAFGGVGLSPAGKLPFEYRVEGGFLAVETGAPQDLRVEVVDAAGHLEGALDRRVGAGLQRIALAGVLPAGGAAAGLHFLRARVNGEILVQPFFQSGNVSTEAVFAPPYREAAPGRAAAKRAAAVDTLRVGKAGYKDFVKEIASYAAGNLGDLALVPNVPDGWVNLFNGKDLTGWIPAIHRSKVGVNTDSTFRPDPENNGIRISYDKYTGDFGGGNCKCGLLYYNKMLTNYRIRVTYRFFEPQAGPNPPSWGRNNSGLMIFGIDPNKIPGDPVFPPIMEIQILGNPSGGGTTNGNYCDMGSFVNPTITATHTGSCGNNKDSKAPGSGKPSPQPDVWTTLEADVHVAGETKVYQWPDTANAVLIVSNPKYGAQAVTGGFLALQSESQPIVFKDILLKELPQ
jgi:hypothetical protein